MLRKSIFGTPYSHVYGGTLWPPFSSSPSTPQLFPKVVVWENITPQVFKKVVVSIFLTPHVLEEKRGHCVPPNISGQYLSTAKHKDNDKSLSCLYYIVWLKTTIKAAESLWGINCVHCLASSEDGPGNNQQKLCCPFAFRRSAYCCHDSRSIKSIYM